MYQVKYKAVVIAPEGSPVKYKPRTQTGLFMPKGKTCNTEKIKKQCIDYIAPKLKYPPNMKLIVTIISIKKLPNAFLIVEDEF